MTARAVIYARYSSEAQREASIEDQLEVCRRYIARQGWTLGATYEDRAMSGASRFRPGFQKLLLDAKAGAFDVVVCEAIDRLGRKLADVADFFDQLAFHRVQVHATQIGLVTQMHIGIMGTMAQMTLADLREKTRRGQLGRARAGRIPGGLAYGYEVVPPAPGSREAGERRIKEAEAAVVRRVFRAYAAGASARHIARDLNAEGIPGPGGRPWGDTTIRGQLARGTGLLNNTLYIGQLSWNRCSYVKDPRTGKRVARINPTAEREEVDVPELRIIDQELWERAKERQQASSFAIGRDAESGSALNRAHRRQFLLSGLLVCGCCGGGYTVMAKDRYGCAAHRGKGTCVNSATIQRQRIEARILGGLKERLLTPDLVAEFIRAFEAELATMRRESADTGRRLERELAEVGRKLEGVVRAIEDGAWNDTLRQRLNDLEARKAELTAALAKAANPVPTVRLHPNAAEVYRAKVAELEASLNAADIRLEASEALRSLISRIVLTPDGTAPDGLAAELHGDLATILRLASQRKAEDGRRPRVMVRGAASPEPLFRGTQLSVVAGNRSYHDLRRMEELAAQVKMVAGERNHHDLLFRAAA